MPNLDVLDPTLSTTILTLGLALVVAAIVGGGFEAAGTRIPVITGWRRQAGAAAFGLALIGFGWSALQAAHWRADYTALVKGMSAPPTLSPAVVADNLNELAMHAASDINRNCQIAYFIYNHKVDIPIAVRLQLVSAQHGPTPALQCYIKVADLAAAAVTQQHDVAVATVATSLPTAHTPSKHSATEPPNFAAPPPLAAAPVSDTPAERILEALTQAGATGWVYLGRMNAGKLGAGRTVLEDTPKAGQPVTTATAVHLRDPAAENDRSHARVVGIVPKGSTLTVDSMVGSRDVWARVTVKQLPPTPR